MSIEYSGYWSFICNPKFWDIERVLTDMKSEKLSNIGTWTVPEYMKDKFEPGQYGIIRVGKDNRAKKNLKVGQNKLESGVYSIVKIISNSKKKNKEYKDDQGYNLDRNSSYLKSKYYVEIEYIKNLIESPLLIKDFRDNKKINKDPYFLKGFQASAISIQKIAFEEILEYTHKNIESFRELNDSENTFVSGVEGHPKLSYITTYERDPKLRKEAIRIHGCICAVCGFDFKKTYGELGKGYIHIHHKVPVSELEEPKETNPKTDLVPLCANCHSMIHRRKNNTLSVEELKEILR